MQIKKVSFCRDDSWLLAVHKCPICKLNMEELKELSRGMGNQAFFKCPFCGTVALFSGERITQSWPPKDDQEGKELNCLLIPKPLGWPR